MKKLIVATNLTDLHKGPSFLDEMLTQLTNGMSVEVLEEQEKWLRVREEGGYEGWAYRGYFAEGEKPHATHVTHGGITLFSEPFERSAESFRGLTHLPVGTFVRVVETREKWVRLQPFGTMLPAGWVNACFLTPLPLRSADVRRDIVVYSGSMTGTYYLWGGNSEWGTDCSGLTMMTHRLVGITLPRDAWMQHRDAKKVDTAQPGDLFFFWNDARTKIGHVGICTGGWNMIHSSRSRNGVYEEDIQSNPTLKSGFAGAGTFLG